MLLISLELFVGWKYEVFVNDVVCFYCCEEFEFNGQCVILELMVDMLLVECFSLRLNYMVFKWIWN